MLWMPIASAAVHAGTNLSFPFAPTAQDRQDVRLVAEVSEQFEVAFTANGQLGKFRAPSFEGFTVVSGPNQATSVQYVNGAMAQSLTFSYILQAKSLGQFSIGEAMGEAGGKNVQSKSVTIQVVKSTPQSQQQRQQQRQQSAEEASAEAAAAKELVKSLFLRVTANKTSVMRGEPLVATYKLYTRVSLVNYLARKAPALTGFWNQDIGDIQQLNFSDEIIGGQTFRVAALKRVLLFPQQSGTLELDPLEADVIARVQARRGGGSVFDQFFNGDPFGGVQDTKLTIKSLPVKITVRSLPQTNAGAVGSGLRLQATLSQNATKTNEPVKLTLKLSGKGNLKLIEPIRPAMPPDVEVYDPTVNDNVTVSEAGASGSKTFEYLLIPRFAGTYKIPPVVTAYYDLDQKRYVMLTTQEFTLTVAKGKDDTPIVAGNTNANKENLTPLASDIRFIKSVPDHVPLRGEGFFLGQKFFGLLALPPLLFLAFIVYRRKTEELRSNIMLVRHRGATRVAKSRLKHAQSFLAKNDNAKFHDEVAKSLWGYLSDKLSIPPAMLTREHVAATLTAQGVSQSVVQQFAVTLDTCEYARFAPLKNANAMEHLYDDAITLISNIERELKSSQVA
jgi:hypothetical protein